MLITERPLKFSKINGYAQSVVIVRDTTVHTTVRNTVQKNALIKLSQNGVIVFAFGFCPFGSKYTSCLISASVVLNDLASRLIIGTIQTRLTMIQIMTKHQSPIFADFDLIILFSSYLSFTRFHVRRASWKSSLPTAGI